MCVTATFRYVYVVPRRKTGGRTTLMCPSPVRRVHAPTGLYNNRFVCSFPTHSTRYGHAVGNDVRKRARGKAIGKAAAAAAASPARVNGVPLTAAWAGGEVSPFLTITPGPDRCGSVYRGGCTAVFTGLAQSCTRRTVDGTCVRRRRRQRRAAVHTFVRLLLPRQFPIPSIADGGTGEKNYCHPLYYPFSTPVHVVEVFGTRSVANIFYYPINLYTSLFFFFAVFICKSVI